jgi:hypothetical protein
MSEESNLKATRRPTIEWHITDICNYNCSYCIQGHRRQNNIKKQPGEKKLKMAVDYFKNLPGIWEIKCEGGEAFAFDGFMKHVVPGLMNDTPHFISILSNFSVNKRMLEEFVFLTKNRLKVFSTSLHLEHTSVDDFIEKAKWFKGIIGDNVNFVTNQVIVPDDLDFIIECRDKFFKNKISWYPQMYQIKNSVYQYPEKDKSKLKEIIGENPTIRKANIVPSFKGKTCWAGSDYFIIEQTGNVWRCRPSRKNKKDGFMGNIYKGNVKRYIAPKECLYERCSCSVPVKRGMIEGVNV